MHKYFILELIFKAIIVFYHDSIVLLRSNRFFLPGLNQQKVTSVSFFSVSIFFFLVTYIYIYIYIYIKDDIDFASFHSYLIISK